MTHHHVDRDFYPLGYAYANDNRSPIDKETTGCIKLWSHLMEGAHDSIAKLRCWVKARDFGFVYEVAGGECRALAGRGGEAGAWRDCGEATAES
jgi:hypothetical protein